MHRPSVSPGEVRAGGDEVSVPLSIEIASDEAGLQALRPHWNALLRSSQADSLFLTWEWVSAWWNVYGRGARLHVLVAREPGGGLVGLAPLMIVNEGFLGLKFERVGFVGGGGEVSAEYLDLIVNPGFEADVVHAFARSLLSGSRRRVIDLRPMRQTSSTLGHLSAALASLGLACQTSVVWTCPGFELPDSPAAFLQGQSRNYRKKVGEYERRCTKQLEAQMRMSVSAAELKVDMETLVTLHHRRWQGRSRAFQTPEYRRFHADVAQLMLDRGWTRMFTLESHGVPVAMLYCFAYGDKYYYYQSGWDPAYSRHRVGIVLMHRVIQQAIGEGARVFDFLRGEEAYKLHWATQWTTSVRFMSWTGAGVRGLSWLLELMRRVAAKRWDRPVRVASPDR